MSDIIKLNVGGTVFTTSKSTLLSGGGSHNFFDGVINGNVPVTKLDDGSIFIDRDPAIFEKLLKILRGYSFRPWNIPEPERTDIFIDADFYGFEGISRLNLSVPKFVEKPGGDSVAMVSLDTPLVEMSIQKIKTRLFEGLVIKIKEESHPIFADWINELKSLTSKKEVRYRADKNLTICDSKTETPIREISRCLATLHIRLVQCIDKFPDIYIVIDKITLE